MPWYKVPNLSDFPKLKLISCHCYHPFVLKMVRPFSRLKDILIMLHLIPGFRFGLSTPSFPGGYLAPWKMDSLLITRMFLRSLELCEKSPVSDGESPSLLHFSLGKCVLPPNWHNPEISSSRPFQS